MGNNTAYDNLAAHGIKPSLQRMAIMQYLQDHPVHPNADTIYQALVGQIPTLSKTTVYNTLRLLVEQGAARMLTIDGHNVCFDGETRAHGHFLCRCCGRVFDVDAEQAMEEGGRAVPAGFAVEATDLYFRGVCGECAARTRQAPPRPHKERRVQETP